MTELGLNKLKALLELVVLSHGATSQYNADGTSLTKI